MGAVPPLTAFANKGQADRALQCGFQIHVRKPAMRTT
jgi:hypothetical protein